ncbi:MAG: TIGR00730 family Rossman fold protein [Vicinamibacterales bacterium]
MKRVCVFCGSSAGVRPAYSVAARAMGTLLATRGIGLVYGGGNVGLMGVVADAALAAGGEVIGVIPRALADKEVAHSGLTDLRVVDSMHTRKAMMADLADGFVAMPGGVGTFEEFFEAVTWTQLGLHRKACGLLNVDGFYSPLAGFIDRAVAEGFIKPLHRGIIVVDDDPARLLDRLLATVIPAAPKWIRPDET